MVKERTASVPSHNPDRKKTSSGAGRSQRMQRNKENPETLEIKKTIAQLSRLFPKLFNYYEPRPLKIGILDDLSIVLKNRIDKPKSHFKRVLSYYTGTKRYLKCILNSEHRYDLLGRQVGEITEEHKLQAQERLDKRYAAKRRG